MAKVMIVFEDAEIGCVSIISEPALGELERMMGDVDALTNAQVLALTAWNVIFREIRSWNDARITAQRLQ